MKTILIVAGAAALALSGVSAEAKGTSKHTAKRSAATYASPPHPIPYAMLDEYLKASPQQRASRDWSAGAAMAQTGAPANVAASEPAHPGAVNPPPAPKTPPGDKPH